MGIDLNLRVDLAPRHPKGLLLANPVMVASGTFGYGTEYNGLLDIQRIGAIVCKGTTLWPRKGNPQPRLVETASGNAGVIVNVIISHQGMVSVGG